MSYEDLFDSMPCYQMFRDIKALKILYSALSSKKGVDRMTSANDIARRPAICGMIDYIVKFCNRHKKEGLELKGADGHFLRRFIGAMINHILTEKGYERGKNPKILGGEYSKYSEYFRSGACYEKPGEKETGRKKSSGTIRESDKTYHENKSVENAAKTVKNKHDKGAEVIAAISRALGISDKDMLKPPLLRNIDLSLYITEAFQTAAAAALKTISNKGHCGDKFVYFSHDGISYPFSDLVLEHARCHFMSAYQIAAEIELNHPGIIEMAGTFFSSDEFVEPDYRDQDAPSKRDVPLEYRAGGNELSFVELIERHLILECIKNIGSGEPGENREGFEMAALSDFCAPKCSVFRNGEAVPMPSDGPLLIFRPASSHGDESILAEKMAERANRIDSTYSSQFFERFDLSDMIVKTLTNRSERNYFPAINNRLSRSMVFLTLNQLKKRLFDTYLQYIEDKDYLFDKSKKSAPEKDQNFLYNLDNYPGYAIYLELLKRRLPELSVCFLSTRHLIEFALSRRHDIENDGRKKISNEEYENSSDLTELGSYIPLIASKLSALANTL